MGKTGEWGEFFSTDLTFFAYNESVAQDYFPLSKEEVLKKGWKWKEEIDSVGQVTRQIPAERLPDKIDDIPDDILNWAIRCKRTGRLFRLAPTELKFYRDFRLPVPHLHPDGRRHVRMHRRNPRKMWSRKCAKCSAPIQTTYSPERLEIVYCENCYLKEVY